VGHGLVLVACLLAQVRWVPFGVVTEIEDRGAPAVMVRSGPWVEFVLLRTGTERQARRAREKLQRELANVGEAEFRRRYGLRDSAPTTPGRR
jgi:hypothetical protein